MSIFVYKVSKQNFIWLILSCTSLFCYCQSASIIDYKLTGSATENDFPVIGVLSQEISYALDAKYPGEYKSYIAASYVKFVEGGGARAVPIWIDQPREYYEHMLSKVNGILLPGGATWFNQSDGYADAGRHIYDIGVELNDQGEYFPIWGTCLGFELLTYLDANRVDHRAHCASNNQALPLEFTPDFKSSKMYAPATDDIIEILRREDVTSNFHQFCVTMKNLTDYNLDKNWRVMSLNKDWNGLEFISSIEHKRYPFYGIQFHPEKNLYEWIRNKNITHTANAIRVSQYFAEFFVNEARKNANRFENAGEENQYLIYNFEPVFTGAKKSSFEQCYMFDDTMAYNIEDSTDDNKGKGASAVHVLSSCMIIVILINILLF